MLLSDLLKQMSYEHKHQLIGERPFLFLAICSSTRQGHCTFVESEKYLDTIAGTPAMIITTSELVPQLSRCSAGLCVVDNPKQLFFSLHNFLADKDGYSRGAFDTVVGEGSSISHLASVAPRNVVVGSNVLIEEFVVVRENTVIGDGAILRAGCVIGGQGYEFKRESIGILPISHVGGVRVGAHVEIQYNTCVDRAVYPWDDTVIGDYTKIDNLVHVAHGVKIGANVMVVANAGIGGRTIVNEGSWVGFGATLTNGIELGVNSRANIGSVVTKSVPSNASVSGNFAIEHGRFLDNLKRSLKP